MNAEFVQGKILRICIQPRTFDFISSNLDGLDPLRVVESLRFLERENRIEQKNDLWVIKDNSRHLTLDLASADPQLYLKKYMGYFDFLKIPHPLDFEWRNSTASLNYLLGQVQELNAVSDEILFLGMPTLFALACQKDIPQKVTLVERNKPIIRGISKLNIVRERFKIIAEDIFKVNPHTIGKFHSAFMDPPWYSPFFFQFMWLAAKCVRIGGLIGISLPPLNTRPRINEERLDWLAFCQRQGLCLETLLPQKLHYAMPFFEFNAFRAAGITGILPFWRGGDFAIFRKIESIETERPPITEVVAEWIEREMNTVRIRVKIGDNSQDHIPLEIKSLVKGDILPTVSTRDERRKEANVWTSGNRVFKVNNPSQFLYAIDLSKGRNTGGSGELAHDFLTLLTELENKEYNDYLNWLYHEMERQTS